MTRLHNTQTETRNGSAVEKSEEKLPQSMRIIPKFLSSAKLCQNTNNCLICYGIVKVVDSRDSLKKTYIFVFY